MNANAPRRLPALLMMAMLLLVPLAASINVTTFSGGDAEAVAPTSFLLGCGNWIFSANARMNPWVHLETHHRSIAPIRQGETVRCEMLVEEWFERKGHLFADVTVSLFEARSKAARAVIHQRAIYRLRGSDAPA